MDKIIKNIRSIKSILENLDVATPEEIQSLSKIEKAIGRKLPDEIKCFLVRGSKEVREITPSIFMGYEPIELESLVKMYESPMDNSACIFLSGFTTLDSDLNIEDDEALEQIQDLSSEVEDGPRIADLKSLVPIMSGDGYYMVLRYKPDHETELAIVTEDFCVSSQSPSISEYLFNLELGIKKGVFEVFEDEEYGEFEIIAPEIWKDKTEAVI